MIHLLDYFQLNKNLKIFKFHNFYYGSIATVLYQELSSKYLLSKQAYKVRQSRNYTPFLKFATPNGYFCSLSFKQNKCYVREVLIITDYFILLKYSWHGMVWYTWHGNIMYTICIILTKIFFLMTKT